MAINGMQYRFEIDYLVLLALAVLVYAVGYVALMQPTLFREPIRLSRATTILPGKMTWKT